MTRIVSLYSAKTHLSALVAQAASGEEVVITKNGVPQARLVPVAFRGQPRKPANAMLYQVPERVTHRHNRPRHADAGRHPRLPLLHAAKSWMPTCVGMTMLAPSMCQSLGRLVLRHAVSRHADEGRHPRLCR